jgi:hypothetical protein
VTDELRGWAFDITLGVPLDQTPAPPDLPLDVITPCALTGPQIRAFAAGGAADAHVVAAALGELRK